jgi:hypothetical protein
MSSPGGGPSVKSDSGRSKRGLQSGPSEGELIPLPGSSRDGSLRSKKAIAQRRSRRAYLRRPIATDQVSQLLWAVQGAMKPDRSGRDPRTRALEVSETGIVPRSIGYSVTSKIISSDLTNVV